jgi:ribonuclease HI
MVKCPLTGEPHVDTVVIAVDGACRNNGYPYARAGAGVFFHRANRQWNEAVLLSNEFNTSQRAELFACIMPVRSAKRLRMLNPSYDAGNRPRRLGPMRDLRRVVIKADSEYLVKGMTEWINN